MSAKYVMRYFAVIEELSNRQKPRGSSDGTSIEDAVLSTNPIMEVYF
jgi:myosin heavy subunit